MKLFIPPLGTVLQLTADWSFRLYNDYRNDSLRNALDLEWPRDHHGYSISGGSVGVTIPAGSQLKLDRLYVRKGQAAFDSATFYLIGKTVPQRKEERKAVAFGEGKATPFTYIKTIPKKNVRFWAKLPECNNIECEIVEAP